MVRCKEAINIQKTPSFPWITMSLTHRTNCSIYLHLQQQLVRPSPSKPRLLHHRVHNLATTNHLRRTNDQPPLLPPQLQLLRHKPQRRNLGKCHPAQKHDIRSLPPGCPTTRPETIPRLDHPLILRLLRDGKGRSLGRFQHILKALPAG